MPVPLAFWRLWVALPSTWKKRSKTRSAISAGKPGPLSLTQAVTCDSVDVRLTAMRPPRGVNFAAFDSRLTNTRSTRSRSHQAAATSTSAAKDTSMFLREVRGSTCATSWRR
jgi:hypothetical protein